MILSVLKIIGIILLIIIGLLIFILGLVLFVPIRYRFEGSYQEALNGEACVRWTPAMFKISVYMHNNRPEYIVKLFGGVVITNTDRKISWIGRKFFSFEEDIQTKEDDLWESAEEKEEKQESSKKEKETGDTLEEGAFKEQYEEKFSEKGNRKKRTDISVLDKIHLFFKKWKEKWNTFLRKIKEIGDKKDALLKVYHSKRFALAKQDIITYIKRVFRIIRPDELEGFLHFGLEDPAITGEILGILAIILPLYQGFLTINPDFTKSCLDGTLKGKGKIFLFPIVKLAIKVILNKNLIKVTKKVQTILEA